MRGMPILVLAAGLSIAAVTAAQEPSPPEPAPSVTQVGADAGSAPTQPQAATAAGESKPDAPTVAAPAQPAAAAEAKPDAEEKRLYTAGYRPEMQNGVRMWCRKELALGSRLTAQKNCGTVESLAQAVQQNQRQIDDAQRKTGFYPKNTKTP